MAERIGRKIRPIPTGNIDGGPPDASYMTDQIIDGGGP